MLRFVWLDPLVVLAAMPVLLGSPGAQAQGPAAPAPGASSIAPAKSSIETGRELFSVHCLRCHGADATGSANGPNLLLRVKGMSKARFASAVLQRYRWTLPATGAGGESSAREAMIRGVLSRQEAGAGMPAWESQPAVAQGIDTLYEYLSSKTR